MSLLSMRTNDPKGLAVFITIRRVERGVTWLHEHAPTGWWRNMFDVFPGHRAEFRARDRDSDKCVLALAFESRREFVSAAVGRVTSGSVLRALVPHLGLHFQHSHGFLDDPVNGITSKMLDAAWEQTLLNMPAEYRAIPRIKASQYQRYQPKNQTKYSGLSDRIVGPFSKSRFL